MLTSIFFFFQCSLFCREDFIYDSIIAGVLKSADEYAVS